MCSHEAGLAGYAYGLHINYKELLHRVARSVSQSYTEKKFVHIYNLKTNIISDFIQFQ